MTTLNDFLEKNTHQYDVWKSAMFEGESSDVMSSPQTLRPLLGFLRKNSINFYTLINDVGMELEREKEEMLAKSEAVDVDDYHDDQTASITNAAENRMTPKRKSAPGYRNMTWDTYHKLPIMYGYLDYLAEEHPEFIEGIIIGYSYQDRPLKAIRIGRDQFLPDGSVKPAIWIDGGFHAREWVSPAASTYIIKELVDLQLHDPTNPLVNYLDWYIMPVANPDGYEYTHTNTRLWRKTRSPQKSRCRGVDLNRNFPFHWRDAGGSSNPCTENYAGPQSLSEPESKALAAYIMSRKDSLKAYLTLHSYGQYWLTPWGHTRELPHDYDDLYKVAIAATESMKAKYGSVYDIGPTSHVLYYASGTSDSWAKGMAGIKYSYTVELRDRGRHGFLLPPREILPTSEEIWEGVKSVANSVMKIYDINPDSVMRPLKLTLSSAARNTTEVVRVTTTKKPNPDRRIGYKKEKNQQQVYQTSLNRLGAQLMLLQGRPVLVRRD